MPPPQWLQPWANLFSWGLFRKPRPFHEHRVDLPRQNLLIMGQFRELLPVVARSLFETSPQDIELAVAGCNGHPEILGPALLLFTCLPDLSPPFTLLLLPLT